MISVLFKVNIYLTLICFFEMLLITWPKKKCCLLKYISLVSVFFEMLLISKLIGN